MAEHQKTKDAATTKTNLPTLLGDLRKHASVLMKMPASEQMIGARDAVMFSALNQIADALEIIAKRKA